LQKSFLLPYLCTVPNEERKFWKSELIVRYTSVTTMTIPLSSALWQGESKKEGEAEGNKFQAIVSINTNSHNVIKSGVKTQARHRQQKKVLKNLEIKKFIRNICKDVHYNISVGAKDYKQKIRRKIVAYMLALEVEDLGTADVTTSLQFRQYTNEVQTTNNLVAVRFRLYKRGAR